MTQNLLQLNGLTVLEAKVYVPQVGPWFADCDMADDTQVSGSCTLTVGSLTLRGTIVDGRDGTFGLQRKTRVVAGAGGWGMQLTPKAYHNDAGVRASLVIKDAAHECGETTGSLIADTLPGVDYVRGSGPASQAIEDVTGGNWWVDFDGVTQTGARATTPVPPDSYDVLHFDPRNSDVEVAVDDPAIIGIGSVLTERLDSPITVSSYVIDASSTSLRIIANGIAVDADQLTDLFRGIISRLVPQGLFGIYRYRVVGMTGDRVNLQATRKVVGLPDLLSISIWPGVPGATCTPTEGSEVMVQFEAGDRSFPFICNFIGGDSSVPNALSFMQGTAPIARIGDTVDVFFPPAVPVTGTVSGAPFTGVITIVTPGIGIIKTGQSKLTA